MLVLLGELRNWKIGIGVKHTSQRIPCTESTPRTSKLLAVNSEFFYSEAFFTAKVVWNLNLRRTTEASWHKISARSWVRSPLWKAKRSIVRWIRVRAGFFSCHSRFFILFDTTLPARMTGWKRHHMFRCLAARTRNESVLPVYISPGTCKNKIKKLLRNRFNWCQDGNIKSISAFGYLRRQKAGREANYANRVGLLKDQL